LTATRPRQLAIVLLSLVAVMVVGCSSGLPETSANTTVCRQISPVLNAVGGHTFTRFESQLQADVPPSPQLDQDVTNWLTMMQAGDEFPGSGEQTQTAQVAYAITKDCQSAGHQSVALLVAADDSKRLHHVRWQADSARETSGQPQAT
jgi:hypothetical protein